MRGPTAPKDPEKKRPYFYIMREKEIFGLEQPDGRGVQFLYEDGGRLMEGVAQKKELDMFRAEQMHFASCRDQALFVIARDRGDMGEMRRIAKVELERAKEYWRIVRADSRIGYESSNHYFFVPRDVLEKVLSCRAIIDGE